jgi:hypothetical protein
MLRQLRSAGGMAGMQEMMKSMGLGGEGAPSMEDMQSEFSFFTHEVVIPEHLNPELMGGMGGMGGMGDMFRNMMRGR